ncbi:MAG TPA: tetratricopeptide repeat protein [Geobacteraceae bacterium]|nr:tetratricopeptide repeat protein [Geobacteraceae bacterium]
MKRFAIAVTFIMLSFLAAMTGPAAADFNSGLAAYRQGDYAAALREFRVDDSAQAKYYLSMMYEKGDGVPQDREQSVQWLTRAAEQGLDVAQANLGLMYCAGYIVRQDKAEGLKWLRKAAEQGLAEAQTVLFLAKAGN